MLPGGDGAPLRQRRLVDGRSREDASRRHEGNARGSNTHVELRAADIEVSPMSVVHVTPRRQQRAALRAHPGVESRRRGDVFTVQDARGAAASVEGAGTVSGVSAKAA